MKDADELTAKFMWDLAGTWQKRRFAAEDAQKFSCEDLRTINNLWTENSNQHFGFSVQRRIWQHENRDLIKFMESVSWGKLKKEDGKYIFYFFPVTNFSLKAPKGQFPWFVAWSESNGLPDREAYLSMIARCGIQ